MWWKITVDMTYGLCFFIILLSIFLLLFLLSTLTGNLFFYTQKQLSMYKHHWWSSLIPYNAASLTLWLCSGQIDPKKIFFFPKILVNIIALDSNLLTLFTSGISTSHYLFFFKFRNFLWVLFHLLTLVVFPVIWPDSKQLLINLSLCYIITKYWIYSFCQLVFFHLGLVLCFYLNLINRKPHLSESRCLIFWVKKSFFMNNFHNMR